jgi:SAM-dependent methyltransferase
MGIMGSGMFERILKEYLWPVIGLCLVIGAPIFITIMAMRASENYLPYLTFGILFVVGLYLVSPEKANALAEFGTRWWKKAKEAGKPTTSEDASAVSEVVNQGILDEDAPPPDADEWNRLLRPVLYQASHYSIPTYYLNRKLQIIDWNVAFELVFRDILGKIRNKHVNYFIMELQNKDESLDHARDFTKKVREGYLALVDIEPLIFRTGKYGTVTFVKVAVLLSDAKGDAQGWSVALMPRDIEWGPFKRDLFDKIREDKLWSVYSASYDRILLRFPPYSKLIDDVTAVVPEGGRTVLDLGAGTGSVTAALLKGGNRVTAIENNLSMLEKLRERNFNPVYATIVKASVDILDTLDPKLHGAFDAAVMVNVLYAVDDPLGCLQSVFHLLKPGGVLAFSTTHKDTRLDPLLDAIKKHLKEIGKYDALAKDYERLYEANKDIEQTIALRHSRDEYKEWVKTAGFLIIKDVPSTYEGAVMLIHAMKPDDGSSVNK